MLARELDVVRRNTLAEVEKNGLLVRDLTRRANHEIIHHVLKHEAIYGGANVTSSRFALWVVLAEQVEETAKLVLCGGFVEMPDPRPEAIPLYASFIAHGVAGAVEAWLRGSAPRDEEVLLSALEAMYPSWYAPEAEVHHGMSDDSALIETGSRSRTNLLTKAFARLRTY